jgi:hypothetical protein
MKQKNEETQKKENKKKLTWAGRAGEALRAGRNSLPQRRELGIPVLGSSGWVVLSIPGGSIPGFLRLLHPWIDSRVLQSRSADRILNLPHRLPRKRKKHARNPGTPPLLSVAGHPLPTWKLQSPSFATTSSMAADLPPHRTTTYSLKYSGDVHHHRLAAPPATPMSSPDSGGSTTVTGW